jgi:hypothetical protein
MCVCVRSRNKSKCSRTPCYPTLYAQYLGPSARASRLQDNRELAIGDVQWNGKNRVAINLALHAEMMIDIFEGMAFLDGSEKMVLFYRSGASQSCASLI